MTEETTQRLVECERRRDERPDRETAMRMTGGDGEVLDERCHIVLTVDQAEALYRWTESDACPAYWETPLAPVQQQVSAWRRAVAPI